MLNNLPPTPEPTLYCTQQGREHVPPSLAEARSHIPNIRRGSGMRISHPLQAQLKVLQTLSLQECALILICCCCCCLVAKLRPTLCDPTDCSPPGFPVHGSSQARTPEWVAVSFPRGSSQPRARTASPAGSLPLSPGLGIKALSPSLRCSLPPIPHTHMSPVSPFS